MLRQIVKTVKDEDFLATLRQCGNASLQVIDHLPVRDGLGHIGRLQVLDISSIGMSLARALRTIGIDGPMGGDMPQERQRLLHLAGRRTLQQLHTHILQDVAREMTVAKATAHVIDQLVVVTQERSEQRRMSGIAQHDQGG